MQASSLKSSWYLRHLRRCSKITARNAAAAGGALQYLKLRHSSNCTDTLLEIEWIIHEKSPLLLLLPGLKSYRDQQQLVVS